MGNYFQINLKHAFIPFPPDSIRFMRSFFPNCIMSKFHPKSPEEWKRSLPRCSEANVGTRASGAARLEGAQLCQVPARGRGSAPTVCPPPAFLLTRPPVAAVVVCAASLLVDVARKKQFSSERCVVRVPAQESGCTSVPCRLRSLVWVRVSPELLFHTSAFGRSVGRKLESSGRVVTVVLSRDALTFQSCYLL